MAERFKTPEDASRLGTRLRNARKRVRKTLVTLAQQTGVDPGQISKMERGQMVTLSPNVQKICNALGVLAAAGDVPSTRAGQRIDALVAGSPISERAVARLIAAIEEVVLEAAAGRPE